MIEGEESMGEIKAKIEQWKDRLSVPFYDVKVNNESHESAPTVNT